MRSRFLKQMTSDPLGSFLESRIADGEFPSASWIVAEGDRIISSGALGFAVLEPEQVPAVADTVYDLASLTKPLATGMLCAILQERGALSLDDKVSKYLDGFGDGEKADLTVADLASHRSGFEAWRPFYLDASGQSRAEKLESVVASIASLPLAAEPRSKVIYSDLNYILLCAILESAAGLRLDALFVQDVSGPLGLTDVCFNPPSAWRVRIAASEKGNVYEEQTARDLGFDTASFDWRREVPIGEVHDGNCSFLEGVSGHAGLFGTSAGVLRVSREFLPGSRLLSNGSLGQFTSDLTPGLEQARSLGFQLASTEGCSAHSSLTPDSFGHLGFTGTMLWIEPGRERVYVLLTNRTHGRRPPFADLFNARAGFLSEASRL